MSDDSDLLIAAAATAAVFTWVGTRRRERSSGVAPNPRWRTLLQAVAAGLARCWRETPGYRFVQGIRDAFFRKR
ncbi:hypothetical protein [Ramlibacter sp.]|uniref:hypothetical protein n=1 Tax=Ramlibacter sp. TaxID=1917967 RepID=UPI002618EC80|nr:hypothetical protein [Ramlibacter sp.]MDB5957887.1 hypothetical protein [Ramlibacter sp.]